ncbi:MAG: UDP-N-acetylglucosamine 1-carboxyvinyltransferase [Microgenomates group bacterium GW2011_GWF2_45_18]|nr:MAG: UDP-N-acetylglucosamine 1-carboxyvinyltransferase [Microgenomates group bacterium GW2011_GWF1_44_10]KKU02358.1 MAG: UDP-N-acetylglucosamine 1-carboxyvinyltransferase [Microgenomates group bacterium GW2011_GWF2_45_18]OGJ41690.1 MAG: UDP-N-acetylglucosamine 1-carboxyvinyltransferase [Candidatus Pacebacteria bacterium RIFOXYB1_FULL_44_10]HAU99175.1 UDP-N-acetylglucosamine 1-carboxyvinyltransferase [Candidatus Paceibacterota bacterium]HAX01705.1 UDP-N-acetylglucosamine 1-carboxyvinyltransfe
METFIIHGGKPLFGSVRLGGAKNASFKLMIASLLTKGVTRLLNFSHINEVQITKDIIEDLGGTTKNAGERTMFIHADGLSSYKIPEKYGSGSRASTMFLAPLLVRFQHAEVPLPGGDAIGKRPIDRHLLGLEALGAKIVQKGSTLYASLDKKGFKGTTFRFDKKSHTGTETLLIAAATASGKTILENAGLEPEIDDLIQFLNEMGAHIRRRENAIIEIDGVKELHPTIYKVMPDRNEAVSYACAAIASKGDIIVQNARKENLEAFLDKLDEMGAGYEVGSYGIRFYHKGEMRAVDVTTTPHPGFMTDWQPLWSVLLTQAVGVSVIHETVSESRFQYVPDLQTMGAKIELFNPEVARPEKVYQFIVPQSDPHFHAVRIFGKSQFKGGEFTVHDLRAGATLVLAGLVSKKPTVLHNVEQIDRGYEQLDTRLRSMGAEIVRVSR